MNFDRSSDLVRGFFPIVVSSPGIGIVKVLRKEGISWEGEHSGSAGPMISSESGSLDRANDFEGRVCF